MKRRLSIKNLSRRALFDGEITLGRVIKENQRNDKKIAREFDITDFDLTGRVLVRFFEGKNKTIFVDIGHRKDIYE